MDIETISRGFSERLAELVGTFNSGGTELRDLVQFMNFIICRHILLRRNLGLVESIQDDEKKIISVRPLKEDQTPLMKEFLRDIDYSPFYYKLWAESDPVPIPAFEEINARSADEAGNYLNTRGANLLSAAEDDAITYLSVNDGKLLFEEGRFDDLRSWTKGFNDLFTEAGNLAVFITDNGYGYDLSGITDLGEIIMYIYRDNEKVYNKLLASHSEVKNLPSEMKEVMSLIYMVTASKAFLEGGSVGGPVS